MNEIDRSVLGGALQVSRPNHENIQRRKKSVLTVGVSRCQSADGAVTLYDSFLPNSEAVDRHLHKESPSFLDTEVLGQRDGMFAQTKNRVPKLIDGREKQKIMPYVVARKRVGSILVMRRPRGLVTRVSGW
jgi:hypothetical protein